MNPGIATFDPIGVSTFPLVVLILAVFGTLFTFVAVMVWMGQKKTERAAYYRHELERRLIEKGELTQKSLMAMREREYRVQWKRRREGLKLGGLGTAAVGAGMLIASWRMGEPDLQTGWIPLIIGVLIFVYGLWFFPKQMNGPENGRGEE